MSILFRKNALLTVPCPSTISQVPAQSIAQRSVMLLMMTYYGI